MTYTSRGIAFTPMMELKDFKINIYICVFVLTIAALILFVGKSRKRFDFSNKLCVITGGSSGLGKALAFELLKKKAHVLILARDKKQLELTAKDLELKKQFKEQKIIAISADVTNIHSIQAAISQIEADGDKIDVLFSCAGSSKPGFFVDQNIDDFRSGMELNYFGTLNAIKTVVDLMIRKNVERGKIIIVSSTLGLMGMIGYSQYSPTKFALRGLAECLRQELIPYGIETSVYFVSTIKSPGYDKENLTKPNITKIIEDGDTSDPSPEARAKTLLLGVEKGQFFITSDIFTDIFRVIGSGISPWNSYLDPLYQLVGQVIIPIWRRYSDYLVVKEHLKTK